MFIPSTPLNVNDLPAIQPQPKFELKKLRQKHKSAVALLVQGMSREEVGKLVGFTPEYLSMLLQQPLVQTYLRELETYMDTRLRLLYGKSVDAIESGLADEDNEVKLKAARLQMEATGKMKPSSESDRTAEDVVAAILARVDVNINVNTGDHNGSGNTRSLKSVTIESAASEE